MTELIVAENIKPMVIFSEQEEMDKVISDIEKQVNEFKPDMSTPEGRKEISSFAYKIARSKTYLDKSGKELTEQAREKIKLINNERNRVTDKLQELQDTVRDPLTKWENAEKQRVSNHEDQIVAISEYKTEHMIMNADDADRYLSQVKALFERDWEEFKDRASEVYDSVVLYLKTKADELKKQEEDRAELERLRKEKEEREAKEREERIAKEAAEAAKQEAEAKAKKEAEEAEAKAKSEREAIELKAKQDREAAEAEKLEAERKAKAEQEESERLKREAEERAIAAEKAQKEAEEEAARQVAEAAENERKRLAAEKKAEEDAAKKREEDNKHKSNINNAALKALVDAGLTEEFAKTAITAIAKGNVPNIKISY